MHDSVMWPVHGRYECRTCGRHYAAFRGEPAVESWKKPALKPVVSLLLLLTIAPFVQPAHAAALAKEQVRADAEAALQRYIARGGAPAWPVESVEIHASLPNLNKSGEFEATRNIEPAGSVQYQIAQLTGDRTVRHEVIARYLTAEERALRTPPASVAISPANYRFAYQRVVDDGEWHAWVFRITPRQKRTGLVRGELWLDVETGLPIRRFGYLVKSPSIWIRRVVVTQDDSLRDGTVASRLTHIKVDTRFAGRAELVIAERPLDATRNQQAADSESNGGQQ